MNVLRHGMIIVLVALLPRLLAAQTPGQQAALAHLRDSLATITDSASVARLEDQLEELADEQETDAMLYLRYGFAALRHAELGNPWRYDRAEDAFRRAAELEPGWPYPLFALGIARYAFSEHQRADGLELGTLAGAGELGEAVRLMAEAVERDPSFAPALVELGRLPWRLHDPTIWEDALMALRRAAASARDRPEVLLAIGRIEREVGNADSAIAAFEMYLAAGGAPGLGRLELARTRFQRGLPGGVAEYYAGAAFDDSATVAEYRADLALIVVDSALAEFDAARGTERADVLRRIWSDRARIDLREPEERLREHYRRVQYARRHFGLPTTRRYYPWSCPYRSGSAEFDDRGIIYIRHGEPTVRLQPVLISLMPNESWRYDRADGDLLFHFGAGTALGDYRLLEGVLDVYDQCTYLSFAGSMSPPPSEVYFSRESLDPMYAKLGAWYGTDAGARLARRERAIGQASIEIGTTTDSHELTFERPLDAVASVLAVGPAGDRALVHVAFGIRGSSTRPIASDRGWAYPVRVRLAAYDRAGQVAAYLDTTVTYHRPAPIDSGGYLLGRATLPVPAGRWRYRLAVEQGDGAGLVFPEDSVRVPEVGAGAGMDLSDLVLGSRRIRLVWRGPAGDTVFFSPFRSYVGNTDLELYYEVYGLEAGSAYQTEVRIVPDRGPGLFRGAPGGIRLRFSSVAADRVTRGRRTIGLGDLDPGRYRLEVRVTNAAGRQVSRQAAFEVRERE